MSMSARQGSGVLALVKRLFSSSQQLKLPPYVLARLAEAHFEVQKLPNQGRGLVASRPLEYGEVLLTEQPFVCCPAISNRKKVCYHCLKVLPSHQQAASPPGEGLIRSRSHTFCSPNCLSSAQASYYTLESQVSLEQVDQYCQQTGERFPLMVARLALMIAQQGMLSRDGLPTSSSSAAAAAGGGSGTRSMGRISRMSRSSTGSTRSSSVPLGTTSWLSSASNRSRAAGGGALSTSSTEGSPAGPSGAQQDVNGTLGFLCFANVPPPPPAPWQAAHNLLLGALESSCDMMEQQEQGEQLAAALQQLDLDWYVAVMARLHLNTFKVDGVMEMDWSSGHAAAAAMLGSDSSTGSALYLLASLFNHSCEPNVNIQFPDNDSTAVFTAARPIAAGEQLFISYIDAEQDVSTRQEFLAFSYGFRCQCSKCQEEVAEQDKHMPPQLP